MFFLSLKQLPSSFSSFWGIILGLSLFFLQNSSDAATVATSTNASLVSTTLTPGLSNCPSFGATYLGTELPGENVDSPYTTGPNPTYPRGFPSGLASYPGATALGSGNEIWPYAIQYPYYYPNGGGNGNNYTYSGQTIWTPQGGASANTYVKQTFTVPCTGTWQIFFTATLQQVGTDTGPESVSPSITVTNTDNSIQTIFPPASATNTAFNFYANCMVSSPFNVGPIAAGSITPVPGTSASGYLCTVQTFYFSFQASLTQGQVVNPPNFDSQNINIIGGEFYAYYVYP